MPNTSRDRWVKHLLLGQVQVHLAQLLPQTTADKREGRTWKESSFGQNESVELGSFAMERLVNLSVGIGWKESGISSLIKAHIKFSLIKILHYEHRLVQIGLGNVISHCHYHLFLLQFLSHFHRNCKSHYGCKQNRKFLIFYRPTIKKKLKQMKWKWDSGDNNNLFDRK